MSVAVLEKARGPGGRMSTRRTDEGLRFNHGAQFFTVRDARFGRLVRSWLHDGLVERWEPRELRIGRGDDRQQLERDERARFVARPGMNAIAHHLLEEVDVRFGRRVAGLRWDDRDGGWTAAIDGEHDAEAFDALIVTAPADQTAALLRDSAPALAQRASEARLLPCWAMMAAFDRGLKLPYEAISVEGDGPIAWAARQPPGAFSDAPDGKGRASAWIVHASSAWSQERLEDDEAHVRDAMLEELARIAQRELPATRLVMMHRWRFALVDEPAAEPALWDDAKRVAAAGDWCVAGRVEAAFLSGCAAAGRVLAAANGADHEDAPAEAPELFS
jgi:predicted NAD/FAD-dependent oxidoreductase